MTGVAVRGHVLAGVLCDQKRLSHRQQRRNYDCTQESTSQPEVLRIEHDN